MSNNVRVFKLTEINAELFPNAGERQQAYYERFGNGDTQSYSKFSKRIDIEEAYQPTNPGASPYHVPRVLIDNTDGRISIYRATDAPELLNLVQKGNSVWMNVFPQLYYDQKIQDPYVDVLKTQLQDRQDLRVIPTSSCRTATIIPSEVASKVSGVAQKVMVKMHCPYFISRFDRRLGKGTIQHCVQLTKELKELLESGKYPKFAILPDSVGVTFNGAQGWGYILRESSPFPKAANADQRTLIPMFALYGRDLLDDEAPSLLRQIIDNAYEISESSMDKKEFAKDFVLQTIIFPLIEFFIVAYKEKGLLLELHGQNTLIELDDQGIPLRIVHRDLDNAVDTDLRKEQHLGLDGFYQGQLISRVEAAEQGGKGTEQSVVFDKSIGKMNLDKLAEAMEAAYGVAKTDLEIATQKHFAKTFPDFRKYFPEHLDCVYNYSNEMRSNQYNAYDIVPVLNDRPRWRPGI